MCHCILECGEFDRDLIRGGHYGQRSCELDSKGRTHGGTDQRQNVKIFLANSEPSTHGAERNRLGAPGISGAGGDRPYHQPGDDSRP